MKFTIHDRVILGMLLTTCLVTSLLCEFGDWWEERKGRR